MTNLMFEAPTLSRAILHPLYIGNLTIDPPLALAPMAGQTNRAFRALCREMGGCGLVCTELLSSQAMQYKGSLARTMERFDWDESETPFAVQLFGSDLRMMAEAARRVVDHGAAIVDINMGCWVPKVAKKGGGAALLRDVCSAVAVVEAVVKAVDVPVTVKVRSGWDAATPTAIAFARAAEQVGVQAVAVHARYAEQGFSGQANWEIIRQVKEAVTAIPVIGNGDVFTASDAARMLAETGCDAVMIGRAALGNPWIFRQIEYELRTGKSLLPPTPTERAAVALRHAYLTLETTKLSEKQALYELRGQLIKYCDGLSGGDALRTRLVRANSLSEIETTLAPYS